MATLHCMRSEPHSFVNSIFVHPFGQIDPQCTTKFSTAELVYNNKTSIYRGSTGRHFKQYLLIGTDAVSSVHHNHGHNSCHLWHGRTMPRLCTISDRVRVNTKSTIMIVQKATIIYNLNSNHLFFRVHHTPARYFRYVPDHRKAGAEPLQAPFIIVIRSEKAPLQAPFLNELLL